MATDDALLLDLLDLLDDLEERALAIRERYWPALQELDELRAKQVQQLKTES